MELSLPNYATAGPNDTSADNLSFILSPIIPIMITVPGRVANGWQVEFAASASQLYVLERSPNLQGWIEVTPPTQGSGQTLVLLDTNAPPDQAYYRASCRQP